MNKREVCWLLVRIGGVCLCLNGFRYVLIVMENMLLVTTARNGELLLSQSSGLIGGWAIEAAISLIAGVYLIKGGDFLFRWLNYEPIESSRTQGTLGLSSSTNHVATDKAD